MACVLGKEGTGKSREYRIILKHLATAGALSSLRLWPSSQVLVETAHFSYPTPRDMTQLETRTQAVPFSTRQLGSDLWFAAFQWRLVRRERIIVFFKRPKLQLFSSSPKAQMNLRPIRVSLPIQFTSFLCYRTCKSFL